MAYKINYTGSSKVIIDGLEYVDNSGKASSFIGERVYFLTDKEDNTKSPVFKELG